MLTLKYLLSEVKSFYSRVYKYTAYKLSMLTMHPSPLPSNIEIKIHDWCWFPRAFERVRVKIIGIVRRRTKHRRRFAGLTISFRRKKEKRRGADKRGGKRAKRNAGWFNHERRRRRCRTAAAAAAPRVATPAARPIRAAMRKGRVEATGALRRHYSVTSPPNTRPTTSKSLGILLYLKKNCCELWTAVDDDFNP